MKRLVKGNFFNAKSGLIAGVIAIILFGAGVATLRVWYANNLKPVSTSQATHYFTVELGDSRDEIAVNLKNAGLIRSSTAFKNYIRSNEVQNLQAGTYILSPSMSVAEIVNKMIRGDVEKNLLTILPGKRLDEVKAAFSQRGYNQSQIDRAFKPQNYRSHPALASLPAGASLEGYLYPDSFQKDAGTSAETIIRQSLDEMEKHLTPDIVNGFGKQGLSTHEGIILASIVLQETDDPQHPEYQSQVAQVFYTRLNRDIPLQSDPTAKYASALAGKEGTDLKINSPYNTYLHKGLPPGPIGNVTKDVLKAVANPARTDYLYFVAGDDKKVHFSRTLEEHQAATERYCTELCGR